MHCKNKRFFFLLMPKHLVLLLFFLIAFSHTICSQENNPPVFGFEWKTHYTYLMAHHEHMRILSEKHFPIYQFNLFKGGDHHKDWHALYRYPQYGVSFIYSPLSSPQYLGFGLGIVPFINFPQYRKNNFSACFFVGSGLGYISKPFDVIGNYKNTAIGSKFNAVMMGQADFRYRVSACSEISAGISITHFSNGKIKTPNLGINNTGMYIGYAHSFVSKKEMTTPETSEETQKPELNVFLASAIKQDYPVEGKYFLYTAFSLNAKINISKKRKIGAGVEVFYDFSDRAYYNKRGDENSDISYMKPALYVLHDYKIGKMSIFLHLGTYLYTYEKNREAGMIYDRTGVQYYFSPGLSGFIALKKHYFQADCLEFAVNLTF
jgi:hypothetical protein